MKLRIRGNSIRIRLDRLEIEQLAQHGLVEDKIEFGATDDEALHYSIEWREQNSPLSAEFAPNAIRIFSPRDIADTLTSTNDISLESEQIVAEGRILRLLVEKDFACLTTRSNEDDTHAFENPASPLGHPSTHH
jgi:hypothetical protein